MKYDMIPKLEKKKETGKIKYAEEPNLINDTNAEIQALLAETLPDNDVKKEKAQRERDGNSRFWFSVYFQNQDQKNEFLKKIGATDITAGQYINGLELAEKLGIELEKKKLNPNIKINKFIY